MKKITELDVKMPHPDPVDDAETRKKQQDDMPTIRRLLKMVAINVPPKGVDDSDTQAQALLKLRIDGDSIAIEDAEFKWLMDNVERNVLGWPGHIHHYALTKMREARERKVDVTVAEQGA